MSLTVNCFENFSVERLTCKCCKATEKPVSTVAGPGLVQTTAQQIVIVATPHISFPELVVYEDLPTTDILMVSSDDEHTLRFVLAQGETFCQGIKSYAPALPPALDKDKKAAAELRVMPSPRPPIEIKTTADLVGEQLTDVMPEYMLKFFVPMFRQTLQGLHLQLTILWMGQTQLLRTFPVTNHLNQAVAAMMVISPYNTDFNGDVTRFTLESDRQRITRVMSMEEQTGVPLRQLMTAPDRSRESSRDKSPHALPRATSVSEN